LKWLLGVAEIHRWHHKREFEDAQVNFGEFWMIWDQLFRSFYLGTSTAARGRGRPAGSHFPAKLRSADRLAIRTSASRFAQ
jgi:sterol desaturase/sphingolipid hydroxylase (fatty acid hydroxylase superfamily)